MVTVTHLRGRRDRATGTVTSISPVASTASSNSGVVSYAVTVALTNVPAAVRSGMSADVTMTIDSATGVLTVPAAALRGTNGNYTVLVLDASGTPSPCPSRSGS